MSNIHPTYQQQINEQITKHKNIETQLQTQIDQLKEKIANLNEEDKERTEIVDNTLKDQLETMTTRNQNLEKQVKQQLNTIDQLLNEKTEIANEMQRRMDKVMRERSYESNNNADLSLLQKQITEFDLKIASLNEANTKLSKHNTQLQNQIAVDTTKITILNKENSELKKQKLELQASLQTVKESTTPRSSVLPSVIPPTTITNNNNNNIIPLPHPSSITSVINKVNGNLLFLFFKIFLIFFFIILLHFIIY